MNQKGFINIVIIGIIVMAGIDGHFVLSQRTTTPAPNPNPTSSESTSTTLVRTPTERNLNTKLVSLGKKFTLKKGETARVKGLNVFLKVKDFIYSPCPKGVYCIWSGLAVVYELTVDGKIYSNSSDDSPIYKAPYDVDVKKTDYKTYATFVINKPEIRCINSSSISQDGCWRHLAKRFGDQSYCNKMTNGISNKDACFEDLAEELKNSNLCQNVVSPEQYCMYLKLVPQNAITKCDSIIIFHWRVSCFKEIANKSGQGINICSTLEPNKARICREAISGPDY